MKRRERLKKLMNEISKLIVQNLTNEERFEIASKANLKGPLLMLNGVLRKVMSD